MGEARIGELFAGYGGLGMGVQAALGGEIAWFSEFDKGPSKILAHRFPGVPNHGDITKIDWSEVEPVDILTGGSPCQDLSHAGKRQGMTEGTRSNLWVAMREAIAALRPSLVVWENVRGAYSAEAASGLVDNPRLLADTRRRDGEPVLRALGRVLGDLSDLGYDAQWHGLRAADVGAPHGRFRVFVVAHAGGLRRGPGWAAGPGEADGGRSSADLAGCGDAPLTLLPTPLSNDRKGYGPSSFHRNTVGLAALATTLLPTPRAGDGEKGGPNQRGSSGDFMLPSAVAHLLPTPTTTQRGTDANLDSREGARANLHNEVVNLLPTPNANEGGQTSRSGDRVGEPLIGGIVRDNLWGQYADAIERWERLTRPAPSPTELGPKGNPRLSAAFSEWMMGLPAGWVTDVPGITRNEALKALGNGVVPQQCAAALREMFAWEAAA